MRVRGRLDGLFGLFHPTQRLQRYALLAVTESIVGIQHECTSMIALNSLSSISAQGGRFSARLSRT